MARDHDIARAQRPGVLADLTAPEDDWQSLGGLVGRIVAEVARKRALLAEQSGARSASERV
jgi:hypothetical protein